MENKLTKRYKFESIKKIVTDNEFEEEEKLEKLKKLEKSIKSWKSFWIFTAFTVALLFLTIIVVSFAYIPQGLIASGNYSGTAKSTLLTSEHLFIYLHGTFGTIDIIMFLYWFGWIYFKIRAKKKLLPEVQTEIKEYQKLLLVSWYKKDSK